jgi:hypothetical protein
MVSSLVNAALALVLFVGFTPPGSINAIDDCSGIPCFPGDYWECQADYCMGPGLPCDNCNLELRMAYCPKEDVSYFMNKCVAEPCDCPEE